MLSSRGKFQLFADADGATKFSDLDRLQREMEHINTKEVNILCNILDLMFLAILSIHSMAWLLFAAPELTFKKRASHKYEQILQL
jgi:hypothetical protein